MINVTDYENGKFCIQQDCADKIGIIKGGKSYVISCSNIKK